MTARDELLAELLETRWSQSQLISKRGRSVVLSGDDLKFVCDALRSSAHRAGQEIPDLREECANLRYLHGSYLEEIQRLTEENAALRAVPSQGDAGLLGLSAKAVGAAMLDAWNEICADTDCHPLDIAHQGKKLFFVPGHWAALVARFLFARSITTSLASQGDAGAREPIGYILEKAGINNGHYFVNPAEYAHVEERFRHIYQPVYASPSDAGALREAQDAAWKYLQECGRQARRADAAEAIATTLREALEAAKAELRQHDADYKHRTKPGVYPAIDAAIIALATAPSQGDAGAREERRALADKIEGWGETFGGKQSPLPVRVSISKDDRALIVSTLRASPSTEGALREALEACVKAYGRQEDGGSHAMDKAIAAAKAALTAPAPATGETEAVADQIIGQIEDRFPNWRGFRDLIDCIDVTLHQLRSYPPAHPASDRAKVVEVADAIDLARFQHPYHPRERDRPFSEADKSDREYATRLALAAIRALATEQKG